MSRFGSAVQNFILGTTIAAVASLLPVLADAQPDSRAPDSAAAPAEKPNDADALQVGDKFFNTKKFLNLTVGVEHDEPIPEDWPKWKPSGSYKKYFNVSVEKDNRSILRFTPTSEGYSVFYIRDKRNDKVLREYRITVKKSKLDNVVREIQALLGDIEGINIKIVNNKVVVDGQILLPRDLGRIHSVLSQFPDQASTLVTMSPLAMKRIADKIREDINNPEITVRAVNDKLILEGVAADEGERDNAELIAKTYLPDLVIDSAEATGVIRKRKPANDGVINLIKVKPGAPPAPKKMVQVVMHFVEMNKTFAKSFRFQWTPTLTPESSRNTTVGFQGASQSAGGITSQIMGVIDNLIPKLNWAKDHGHARVLDSTSIIAEDGGEGKITQQTEFPVNAITKEGNAASSSVPVGITSTVKPTILEGRSASVKMNLYFSVRSLVEDRPGSPIVSNNEITTQVTVPNEQSAAIGGLISNSKFTNYNPPNGLPSNPIISLYASKQFAHKQTQFVVFATPVIRKTASEGSEMIRKKFKLRD